jgi:hypothetical protein
MLSYRLWQALRRPPTRNPLFRRAYSRVEEAAPWYVGCVQWAGILIFLPIIALAGLIYGLGWSVGIANLLGRERENRTFDLLALTPPGPLGMSWAAATGYLYHHRTFSNVNGKGNILARTIAMAVVLGGMGLLFDVTTFDVLPSFGALVLIWITLFIAMLIDHVQSIVVTMLVGIIAADAAKSRLSAQLYAFALYSGVQVLTYVVTLAVGLAFLPPLLERLGVNGVFGYLLLMLLRLALFAGTRELLVWLMWRRADAALSPDPYEQRILLGQPTRKVKA